MIWNWVFILLPSFGNCQILDDSKELELLQRIKNEYNKENDPTRLRISIENNQERYINLWNNCHVQFILFLEASEHYNIS